jgi:hypothetical protein
MVYVETSIDDVREVVKGKRTHDIEELGKRGEESRPMACSPRWWRAFWLYKFLPVEMSSFGQMKECGFWLFTLLSCIPSYGIRVVFFTVLLIAELTGPGPPDEFQLVQFILMFKGFQFLSSGVCMAFFVAVKYFLCVHSNGVHTCEKDGPAATTNSIFSLVDLFGSCILVWTVFWILPSSVKSAGERDDLSKSRAPENVYNVSNVSRPQYEGEVSEVSEVDEDGADRCGCCPRYDPKRGGRLKGLLRYDLVCFILSIVFFFVLAVINIGHLKPGEEAEIGGDLSEGLDKLEEELLSTDSRSYYSTYEFRVAIYWTRIFYSILSAPFFLFQLPVLNGILTHTTFTGYNRYGVCVPFVMPPDDSPLPDPEDDKEV